MHNALITLILFFISAYFINQQFSPKIVNTKKDNAKLWFVHFTSLYMLPVFSQLLNPTIPIVKEMGILGLLVPYIFCALIIYGLGYFFGRNKKSTSSSKKIKSFNSKNIGTEKIIGLILIGLLILGFVITYKDLNFWGDYRNPISQNNTLENTRVVLNNLYNLKNANLKCITEKDVQIFRLKIKDNIWINNLNGKSNQISSRTKTILVLESNDYFRNFETKKMMKVIFSINTLNGSGSLSLPEVNDFLTFNCVEE